MKTILFLLLPILGFAQTPKLSTVEYTHSINHYKNIKDKADYTYTLCILGDKTLYDQHFEEKKNEENQVSNNNSTTTEITHHPKIGEMRFYYKNGNDNFIFRDKVANRMVIVDEEPIKFDWEISNETKMIGKNNCKKATTSFRGRKYTAWFAESIPINKGPWKFYGLPGLIIEVYDDENVLHITASKIGINSGKYNIDKRIAWIESQKRITLPNYIKQKKNERREMVNFLNSRLKQGDPKIILEEDEVSRKIEIFD
jgi:GLPGLI family protein